MLSRQKGSRVVAWQKSALVFCPFRPVPQRIKFAETALSRLTPLRRQPTLHHLEPARKLRIRRPQRIFWIQLKMPCDVRHHKQQVAKLIADFGRINILRRQFGFEFVQLFTHLCQHGLQVRPVKSNFRSFLLQLNSTDQGRQRGRHII